jgi:hypothetical protein
MQITFKAAPGIIGRRDDTGPHGAVLGAAASRQGRFKVTVHIRHAAFPLDALSRCGPPGPSVQYLSGCL